MAKLTAENEGAWAKKLGLCGAARQREINRTHAAWVQSRSWAESGSQARKAGVPGPLFSLKQPLLSHEHETHHNNLDHAASNEQEQHE